MSIHALLPDGTTLLSLQPEELAGLLLKFLNSLPEYQKNKLNRLNFFLEDIAVSGYPNELLDDIRRALMEAWVWLENEGFLAPRPASQGSWRVHNPPGKADAQRRTGRRIPPSESITAPVTARSNRRQSVGYFYSGRVRHRSLPSVQGS